MMVADAGPIISFARIGRLDLVRQVVEEIIIPNAVHEELVARGAGRAGAREATEEPWIRPQRVRDRSSLERFSPVLSPGQREAIVLARDLGLPLLMDERAGRAEAIRLGLDVRGSLRVLAEAKQLCLIGQVRPLVEAMRSATYRIGQGILSDLLEEMGESQDQ